MLKPWKVRPQMPSEILQRDPSITGTKCPRGSGGMALLSHVGSLKIRKLEALNVETGRNLVTCSLF